MAQQASCFRLSRVSVCDCLVAITAVGSSRIKLRQSQVRSDTLLPCVLHSAVASKLTAQWRD